jgi:hypothetical protein
MAKLVKQRVVEIESDPVPRKEMLTVLVLRKLKNVKTHHAPMTFLEKNGNVADQNQ